LLLLLLLLGLLQRLWRDLMPWGRLWLACCLLRLLLLLLLLLLLDQHRVGVNLRCS
jgi:hypothetical protein